MPATNEERPWLDCIFSLPLPPSLPPLSLLKPIAYPFTTTTTITTTTTTRAGATSLREPSAGSSTTPQLPTDPTIHVGPLVAL